MVWASLVQTLMPPQIPLALWDAQCYVWDAALKETASPLGLHWDPAYLLVISFPSDLCCLPFGASKLIFPLAPPPEFWYWQLVTELVFVLERLALVAGRNGAILTGFVFTYERSALCWSWFGLTPHSQQFIFNLLSRSSASEPPQSMCLLFHPILGSWVCFDASSV